MDSLEGQAYMMQVLRQLPGGSLTTLRAKARQCSLAGFLHSSPYVAVARHKGCPPMSVLLSGGRLCCSGLGMHMALHCPLAGRLADKCVLLLQALALAAIAAGAVSHAWLRLGCKVQQWGCCTPASLHELTLTSMVQACRRARACSRKWLSPCRARIGEVDQAFHPQSAECQLSRMAVEEALGAGVTWVEKGHDEGGPVWTMIRTAGRAPAVVQELKDRLRFRSAVSSDPMMGLHAWSS